MISLLNTQRNNVYNVTMWKKQDLSYPETEGKRLRVESCRNDIVGEFALLFPEFSMFSLTSYTICTREKLQALGMDL